MIYELRGDGSMRLLRLLCGPLLGTLLGAVPAQAAPEKAPALTVMVEDGAAPWSQADGSGVANDIVRAAFAAAGVEVELHTVSYARCKYEVRSGEEAACFSMSAEPGLAGKVILSRRPLFHTTPQYFHNPARPLPFRSEADIKPGTVIGVVDGYEYPPAVAALKERGVVLEPVASESANLKKLASGRIDAAIVNLDELKSAQFLVRSAGVGNRVAPLFASAVLAAHIGFSTQHPRGPWARAKFDEGFAAIERDGTLEKIMQRWRERLSR